MLPPPRGRHEWLCRTGERDQRVRADVERRAEAFTARLDEGRRELVAGRERRAVHDEIQPAMHLGDLREHLGDLRIVLHVEREHERRRGQPVGEFLDVIFETALIGEDDLSAFFGGGTRDGPRDGTFVGDADDETRSCQRRNGRSSPAADGGSSEGLSAAAATGSGWASGTPSPAGTASEEAGVASRPAGDSALSRTCVKSAAVDAFFRWAGTLAFLNSCSASQETQRVR
jgi:hypothetical protein